MANLLPDDTVFAHSLENQPEDRWEPLGDHLRRVAALARRFADVFDAGPWGELAGLWHDLGKFRPEFQARLRGSREHVEHAGIGAALAWSQKAASLAFAIAGHHSGLPNREAQGETRQRPLIERIRINDAPLRDLLPSLPTELTDRTIPELPEYLTRQATATNAGREAAIRRLEFWTRFLFSALVDADYVATESFYDGDKRAVVSGFDSIESLRHRLDEYLGRFTPDTDVNRIRARVLDDCRAAAQRPPGPFSLTVPTGGGKTLSGMAFALHHAEHHGLRRVIVVIPYTNIIEQNARVYADILGRHNVIEHHSGIDEAARLEEDTEGEIRRRLASENWDAPVIVTTTVQFFESLFANQPSRCRKLHNIARSVIILDEAQSLPPAYLNCLLDAMRELMESYGCSLVVSTATQPALCRRESLPFGLDGVREIIRHPNDLAQAMIRTDTRWPQEESAITSYSELAGELALLPRVLAIVHLRKDARELARMLPEDGRFHLSALMCPAHRAETLAQVKERLATNLPCRLVATQLVEAGVDIDFPVVYRALAGLDSLAQAAGRCNREGKLDKGLVAIFRAETKPPRGTLRLALESTEAMLRRHGGRLNLSDPKSFDEYFRTLYGKCETDRNGVQAERSRLNFASVAQKVHLIEDGFRVSVVMPWGDSAERVEAFRSCPNRETQRALQPFLVQVSERDFTTLHSIGAVECIHDSVHVLTPPFEHVYDPVFGLVLQEENSPDPAALVIG